MTDDTVVPFKGPAIVGDGIVFEPDLILENAKGAFVQVVVCGYDVDGQIQVRASHGSRDVLWALQRSILHLMLETE